MSKEETATATATLSTRQVLLHLDVYCIGFFDLLKCAVHMQLISLGLDLHLSSLKEKPSIGCEATVRQWNKSSQRTACCSGRKPFLRSA